MPKMKLPKGVDAESVGVDDFSMFGSIVGKAPDATKLIQGFLQNVVGGELDPKRAWKNIQMLGGTAEQLETALREFPLGIRSSLRRVFNRSVPGALPKPSQGAPLSSTKGAPVSLRKTSGPANQKATMQRKKEMEDMAQGFDLEEYLGLKR